MLSKASHFPASGSLGHVGPFSEFTDRQLVGGLGEEHCEKPKLLVRSKQRDERRCRPTHILDHIIESKDERFCGVCGNGLQEFCFVPTPFFVAVLVVGSRLAS
jgi:hypothetical protein